jgi:hypothetical protein
MYRHRMLQAVGWTLFVVLGAVLPSVAQDQGFDVIYEGVVDPAAEPGAAQLDIALYGLAGYSAAGAFWASAGVRAGFSFAGLSVDVDAGYGTDGMKVQAGASAEIFGFGVAGDVTWSPGAQSIIDLRCWGALDPIRVTANVRLAGANTAVTLSGTTDLGGYGLSATVGLSGGTLAQASVGANMGLGGLSISGSAGISASGFNVGGGVGLELGPLNVIANAGYDAEVGPNATVGGSVGWEAFELNVVGLYDNTGVGAELLARLSLGTATIGFTGRFSGGALNAEVNGSLPLGSVTTSFSVAFDSQSGFAWAEVGFEMPL